VEKSMRLSGHSRADLWLTPSSATLEQAKSAPEALKSMAGRIYLLSNRRQSQPAMSNPNLPYMF